MRISVSRMNKAMVRFVKERELVHRLTEDRIKVSGEFYSITPITLGATTTEVTVSSIPQFIPNKDIEQELSRFGKIVSDMRVAPVNCKNPTLCLGS